MKIVAIMQNQWFNNPDHVRQMLARETGERHEKLRRRLIHYALFAGCKSGRVLKRAFGSVCDDIVWEEASREIGGHSSSVFPADLPHIRKVLVAEKPDIVLTFGAIATNAIQELIDEGAPFFVHLSAPHPAARQASTICAINACANALRSMITPTSPLS